MVFLRILKMVLDFNKGLFERKKTDLILRFDEGQVVPVVASTEIVFWHKTGGTGEYYIDNIDGADAVANTTWYRGQQITIGASAQNSDFLTTAVIFKLYRILLPGTVTMELKAVDADGKPTGAVLATATYNGDSLTTDTGGEEITFTFGSAVNLSASTQYAIYLYADAVDGSNMLCIKKDSVDATYTGGNGASSNDSGTTWSVGGTKCYYFKLKGSGDFMLVNLHGTTKQIIMENI